METTVITPLFTIHSWHNMRLITCTHQTQHIEYTKLQTYIVRINVVHYTTSYSRVTIPRVRVTNTAECTHAKFRRALELRVGCCVWVWIFPQGFSRWYLTRMYVYMICAHLWCTCVAHTCESFVWCVCVCECYVWINSQFRHPPTPPRLSLPSCRCRTVPVACGKIIHSREKSSELREQRVSGSGNNKGPTHCQHAHQQNDDHDDDDDDDNTAMMCLPSHIYL